MSKEDRLSEGSLYCNVHVHNRVNSCCVVGPAYSCCTGWWAMSMEDRLSEVSLYTAMYLYIIELTAAVLQDKPTAGAQAGGS